MSTDMSDTAIGSNEQPSEKTPLLNYHEDVTKFAVNCSTTNNIPPDAQCLSGTWKFRLHDTVSEAFEFANSLDWKSPKWTDILVPGHWQLQGFGSPIYTNYVYPFPIQPPQVTLHNPTGTYLKTIATSFREPDDIEKLRSLYFEGVDSGYYVLVNGNFVGYSEGSRNRRKFDIPEKFWKYPKEKDQLENNYLLLIVLQWSKASYIEDQDQWWLSGEISTFLIEYT